MTDNAFWLDRASDAARIVEEATARGFIRRISWTQVEWSEEGLAKARVELAPVSPWLSERMISRLSPLRRANLERRITDHLDDAEHGCNAMGVYASEGPTPHVPRLERMVGRVAMLISNAELRERSERHE